MMISNKWMWILAGVLAFSGTGCHNLQPNQWTKLNRGPDSMPSSDYSFSIPDPPLPTARAIPAEPSPGSCSSNICAE
jgi:hypothetical protein